MRPQDQAASRTSSAVWPPLAITNFLCLLIAATYTNPYGRMTASSSRIIHDARKLYEKLNSLAVIHLHIPRAVRTADSQLDEVSVTVIVSSNFTMLSFYVESHSGQLLIIGWAFWSATVGNRTLATPLAGLLRLALGACASLLDVPGHGAVRVEVVPVIGVVEPGVVPAAAHRLVHVRPLVKRLVLPAIIEYSRDGGNPLLGLWLTSQSQAFGRQPIQADTGLGGVHRQGPVRLWRDANAQLAAVAFRG